MKDPDSQTNQLLVTVRVLSLSLDKAILDSIRFTTEAIRIRFLTRDSIIYLFTLFIPFYPI